MSTVRYYQIDENKSELGSCDQQPIRRQQKYNKETMSLK